MEAVTSKRPTFGIASVVFTLLTVVVPILVFFLFASRDDIAHGKTGWEGVALVLMTVILGGIGAGIAATGGVISGIVGLVRHERWRSLSITGLVMSGAVLAFLTWAYISVRTSATGS